MLGVYGLIDDVCNKKRMKYIGTDSISDMDIGKYMFDRWLSMTHPRNAIVASELFNSYYSEDDIEYLYKMASLFSVPFKKFKYIKKEKKHAVVGIEREWGDEITNREKEMYSETLDFLEEKSKVMMETNDEVQ